MGSPLASSMAYALSRWLLFQKMPPSSKGLFLVYGP